MITGGFGVILDIPTGAAREWYCGEDGVKRWRDNDEPIENRTDKESLTVGCGDD